eukprot:Platyproteum_vivax@DN6389_c0_g1_i1.p1
MRGPLLSCTTNEADKDLALQNAILRIQVLEQQLAELNQEIGALKAQSDCKKAEADDLELEGIPNMKIGLKWHSCANFVDHALTKADMDRIKNTMVTYKIWQTTLSFNNTNADADCAKVIAEIMNLHPQGFEALSLTNQSCLCNEGLRAFLDTLNPSSLKRLKTIDLSGDTTLADSVESCKSQLKSLDHRCGTMVTEVHTKALFGLLNRCGNQLEKLSISFLGDVEFVDGLTTKFPNLKRIFFRGTSEKAIQKLLERCDHLEVLDIKGMS